MDEALGWLRRVGPPASRAYLRLAVRVSPVIPEGRGEIVERGSARVWCEPALIRRVFGKTLIDRFCPFGGPLCQPPAASGASRQPVEELCRLAGSCPYGVLFAASVSKRPPFALYVPDEGAVVEVTLFGPAWTLYSWVVLALADALRTGLGKDRRVFRIEEVVRLRPGDRRERLCESDLVRLPASLEPDALFPEEAPQRAPSPVKVELLSPARLLRDGKMIPGRQEIPFEVLVARILDRFEGLYGPDAGAQIPAEIRARLLTEAAKVPVLMNDTEWLEVPDYSARSQSEILMGGKVGCVVYGPAAAKFLPLLQAGEILHVGKNPTAGCGRILVAALTASEQG